MLMQTLLVSVFLITFLLCFATYFLFPVILVILGRVYPFRIQRENIIPSVSVIIAAYNEEQHIAEKIRNTLALDYPAEHIEILIGSDGSTDNTPRIVEQLKDEKIRFFNFRENRGKTSVQNDLAREAGGDILVFTDAASFLPRNAIKNLVRNFADNRVGCVAGRLRFVDTDQNLTTKSQGLYWRYEVKIRELESRLGSLIGVDGPLYAVRKEYYIPLQANIISDLMTPLLVLKQGKKVILEPDALVDEEPTKQGGHEFNTRRRITLRGLVGIFSHPDIINPVKHPLLGVQIFAHKILRWFVGPLVILNTLVLFTLVFLDFRPAEFLLPVYLFFFISAFFGWIFEKAGKKIKILTIPYYFCLVNLAATFGIVDFFRGKQAVTWKTIRD